MPSYTYSSTTEQFGVASENKILAIKVDTVTDTENWFSVLDQTTAASNGTFQLSWDDWNGRVIIGAVDGDTVVQLDCVFHDYITGTLVTVEEPADLPSNPAFHYAMDTITAIESVGAYTGTVIGTLTSATGKFENAIDTSTGGIDSGYLLQQGVTAYTVSLWFKTSSTPSVYGVLIQDGPGLSINDCRISLKLTDNNRIRLKMGDGTTNSQWYGDTAQFMAPYYDDNWHHMVLVINGTSQKVYVDNVEKAALISNGPAGTLGQENIHIGGQHRVASRDYFDGSMDQVRFYERALNLVEIAQLFNETLTTIPASVLNYTMENNTVSAVPDENGTYDGVITGSFPAVAGRAG